MTAGVVELESSDDRRAIVTPALRLVFLWTGDRWRHQLEPAGAVLPGPLVESVESLADRDDPARVVSPAYQQFHWERRGGSAHAMLLGQSGPHHFSAVFTVCETPQGAEVKVDVADRCRGDVVELASTYHVRLLGGDLETADPGRIVWSPAGSRLILSATAPARIGMAEAGRQATRVQILAQTQAKEYTHRLAYAWQWTAPA